MIASELEKKAIASWYSRDIEKARILHNLAHEFASGPEKEWVRSNDVWFLDPNFRVTIHDLKNSKNTKYKDAKISLLIMGHGRPEGAMRTAMTARVTAQRADLVEIMICTDDTDSVKDRYLALPELTTFSIPSPHTSDKWNFMYGKSSGDIIFLLTDDVIFESWGWDEVLRTVWPDDGVAVMFTDHNSGHEMIEFPIVSRKMADTLGYVAYPKFVHGGLDVFWGMVGSNLKSLYYLSAVFRTRHQHYVASQMNHRENRPPLDFNQLADECIEISELIRKANI